MCLLCCKRAPTPPWATRTRYECMQCPVSFRFLSAVCSFSSRCIAAGHLLGPGLCTPLEGGCRRSHRAVPQGEECYSTAWLLCRAMLVRDWAICWYDNCSLPDHFNPPPCRRWACAAKTRCFHRDAGCTSSLHPQQVYLHRCPFSPTQALGLRPEDAFTAEMLAEAMEESSAAFQATLEQM